MNESDSTQCHVEGSNAETRQPLITFVLAIFNAKTTLGQCLESVMNQNCRTFELIAIDGRSTDGTIDILRNHSTLFSYWVSEPDRGVYDAWNKALKHASGEWICFLGADDYLWSNNVVERLSKELQQLPPHVSIAYGKVVLLDREDQPMYELGEPWSRLEDKFKTKMCLPHPAVMHRRRLFETNGGFDPAFRIAGDYEFLLRVISNQVPHFMDELVITAMRPGGLSSNPTGTLMALSEVYQAQIKNGISVPFLTRVLTYARVRTRLMVVWCLGERAAAVLLDLGRRCLGLPAYWTKV